MNAVYIYIIIFFAFAFSSIVFFNYYRKLKFDHFKKLLMKNLFKSREESAECVFFSEFYLSEITALLLKNKNIRPLLSLINGRYKPAQNALKAYPFLQAVLTCHYNLEEGVKLLKKLPATEELALAYLAGGKKNAAKKLLKNYDNKKLNTYQKARLNYLKAYFFACEGDLEPAADLAHEACKLFNREKTFAEEANAYLLLGQCYRMSDNYDTAQMMLETALKIFKLVDYKPGVKNVYQNLYVLMNEQKRHEEAGYFMEMVNKTG